MIGAAKPSKVLVMSRADSMAERMERMRANMR
jgi:hypothetical protein